MSLATSSLSALPVFELLEEDACCGCCSITLPWTSSSPFLLRLIELSRLILSFARFYLICVSSSSRRFFLALGISLSLAYGVFSPSRFPVTSGCERFATSTFPLFSSSALSSSVLFLLLCLSGSSCLGGFLLATNLVCLMVRISPSAFLIFTALLEALVPSSSSISGLF